MNKVLFLTLTSISFFSGAPSMKRVPVWTHEQFEAERERQRRHNSPTLPLVDKTKVNKDTCGANKAKVKSER